MINFLNKETAGKKDTQTTLLGHVILKSSDTSNFIYLKLVPLFFIKFLFFTKWWSFKNYEKCFLFHLKNFFHSRDIQIFVFSSAPVFPLVSHCFRGWSKKNLRVYEVINCLNTNLITHFVWYLEKEKRWDFETLAIDRELNKEHFYRKIMQKIGTKSYPQTPFQFC